MRKTSAVIAVAGWEDRFELGLLRDLERRRPAELLIITFEEYSAITLEGRRRVFHAADDFGVTHREVIVTRDRRVLFERLQETFALPEWRGHSVLVDISTMPREVIWWICSALKSVQCDLDYIYHQPETYPAEWITRDTDAPRLVYQHSGVSAFGKETALLLLSGFDVGRVLQLIQFFEPKLISIGLQEGAQFDNDARNVEPTRRELARISNKEFFGLDSFGADRGYSVLSQTVETLCAGYNLIAASLGPKPAAISLYRVHRAHPEMALAYAPSRQFNLKYSGGIGVALEGSI